MSVRSFKTLHIPNQQQNDSSFADNSFNDINRTPSFISLEWGQNNRGNVSKDDGGTRYNAHHRNRNVGEIQDLLAKQVHITPRKVGRNLIGRRRDETRRKSCPPTPERASLLDSAQKKLVRRTFHLEDQLNKSSNPDPRSPCLFRLNCYDTYLPENNKLLSGNNLKNNGDDLFVTDRNYDDQPPSNSAKSGNICKEFFKSLFLTVINIIKWCFITVTLVILAVVLQHTYTVYQKQSCDYYTQMNLTSLQEVLSTEVYGQHIVTEAVIQNIRQYLSDPAQGNKPLVFSFYGWTGVGKNFVSGLIADHVRSPTVTKIIVPLHFPHVQDKDYYADQLKQWVVSNISGCAVNLFVIDEIDKASWPIEESFRELVQLLNDLNLAEKRAKVIILLLSNKAASLVNRHLYDILLSGGNRNDVKVSDVTGFVLERTDILNLDVWLSEQSPLNQMLPFLPLERPQVEECIVRDLRMKGKNVSGATVKRVVDSLPFAPKNSPLFSVTGCRKVSSAVDLHSADDK